MEAVVVGLISGVVGVIIGGLLQMRAQRVDQLRVRQIAAADDFASAATEVFVAVTARMQVLGNPQGREQEWLDGFREAAGEARTNVHQTTRRLARLELLFGVGSATAASATDVVANLFAMTEELRQEPGNQQAVVEKYEAAADAFGRFNKSANEVLTLPLWRQWLRKARPFKVLTSPVRTAWRRLRRSDKAEVPSGSV